MLRRFGREGELATTARKVIEQQLDKASDACTRSNTHLTELRRTVLGLVLQAERPLTAYQLLDRLKETRRTAMPPTIYRALEFLVDNKLIHRVERLGAFVPCEAGHHEHAVQFLICRICGQVTELEDRSAWRALDRAACAQGFVPSNMTVEIEGVCSACTRPH